MRNYWRETPNAGRALIGTFSSQLFAMTMGSSILAVVLRTLPYTFPGLYICATIVWVFSLILTAIFFTLFCLKWLLYPASSWHELSHNPEICFFYSSFAITASTLINAMAQILGNTWAGWDIACMVLWWIDVIFAVACAILPVFIAVRTQHIELSGLPPTTFLPGTALLSTGSAGAIIVDTTSLSTRVALPIWVVSCILIGMGFATAFLVLTQYFSRLLTSYTPEAPKALSCFLPVAALSNTAFSCALLGRIAGPSRNILSSYGQGFVANNENIGLGLYGAGVALGLGVFGIAIFWLIFAVMVALSEIRRMPFNITTWAPIYPLGVFATACGQFAKDFDSPAFRTLNTIFLCLILLYWIFCMIRTIPMVISGELFLGEVKTDDAGHWKTKESFGSARKVRTAIQDEEAQKNDGKAQTSPQSTLVDNIGSGGESTQRDGSKGDSRTAFKRSASQQ